jgi:threonine dehydrogenase-like Zn-dependent dehydrogenase
VRAVVYRGVGQVAIDEVADPLLLGPGDAIVQVECSAICGSDLHVYEGRETGLDTNTVMGHEFVGRVLEPGDSGLARGLRVVAPFSTSCGVCARCLGGLSARCERGQLFGWVRHGVGLQGAQAEYVRVPHASASLLPIPEGLDGEISLLLGDVLSTGAYGVERSGAPAGASIAVIGCGPVGLMAAFVAGERGLRVFALDRVPERLAFAERLGAIAVAGADARDEVIERTRGGVAAVIEASGSPAAARLAYELLAPGGVLAIVGVHHEAALGLSPAELYDKNLSVRSGRCPARSLMPQLLPLAVRHAERLRPLFTHRFAFADAAAAYRLFSNRAQGCLKVLLTPD